MARRRRDAAHQVSHRLTAKHTHLAAEGIRLRNMIASARGAVEEPGQLRRFCAYKAGWRGGVFTCVDTAHTSQACSGCGKHPKDDPATAPLAHGRITRDEFLCPLCGFAADADHNAARNIRARGRQHWVAQPSFTAAGPAVAARRALSEDGTSDDAKASRRETGTKISPPNGLPQAA